MADRLWSRPATAAEAEAVERERVYWEEHEDLDWVADDSKRQVVALIPPSRGDALELCIGSGTFTRAVQGAHASYTGLDISRSLLDTLRETLPSVIAVRGNAEELPFEDGTYDQVLVFAGLHHLPRYPRSIAESHRVLRSGGTFFCFEPNALAWYRTPMRHMRDFIGIYSEDETYLDPGEVAGIMTEVGFRVENLAFLTPRFKPSHLTVRNQVLAQLMYGAARLGRGGRTQSFFAIAGSKG